MANYSARDRQRWLQASPTHNKIFQWIMEYGTMCQDFLKEIIPERDFSHLEIISEKSLKNVNHKEIRLDILATDKQGNKYNIEMQVADEHNVVERLLYYQSLLVAGGDKYQDIRQSYVIFLCLFSPLKDVQRPDRVISHLERRVTEELEYSLKDRTHTILLNLDGDLRTVNPNLRGFIQALKQQPQTTTSDLGNQLIQAFKDIKADQGKERSYMMLTKAEQDEIRMKERLESAKRYIPRLRIEERWDAAMEEFDYDADKAKDFLEENNIEY
ncbi:MAG: Rpn family recombination-promoting nuclease/putative transposase [Ligilactobacillus saerimneri]|nr:Rpn family recombination-promoting nuclease/putative transposase [Ligilactobacillus saerimneri]